MVELASGTILMLIGLALLVRSKYGKKWINHQSRINQLEDMVRNLAGIVQKKDEELKTGEEEKFRVQKEFEQIVFELHRTNAEITQECEKSAAEAEKLKKVLSKIVKIKDNLYTELRDLDAMGLGTLLASKKDF